MSRRIQIVLPDQLAEHLDQLAAATSQRTSTLAGQLVRSDVEALIATGHRTPPTRPASLPPDAERPGWLEPYGGNPTWRKQMWGAVVALRRRYPNQLQNLKTGWWDDDAHLEVLCALVVWRARLDDSADDPREEISFHNQLTHYTQQLQQQGGSVTKTWNPDTPAEEWTSA